MSVVYLTKQGTCITKERGRMVVSDEQIELFSTPWAKIESVIIFGNIQLSTQAIGALLEHDINVSFLTTEGVLKGELISYKSKNSVIKLNQYETAMNNKRALDIAAAIVQKKISNQLKILKEFKSNHPEVDFFDPEYSINNALNKVNEFKSRLKNYNAEPELNRQTLMGLEGIASKNYFSAMRQMFTGELKFSTRSRRPPLDEVNAILSLGYTLLGIKISAIIRSIGFEPMIGFLHSVEYGRESLMLDILELFRQPVVDKLAMNMCNKLMLNKDDFENRDGGIYLKPDKMSKFIKEFEETVGIKKETGVTVYQRITAQVHELARAIQDRIDYKPI